jgi:hypothetical protein
MGCGIKKRRGTIFLSLLALVIPGLTVLPSAVAQAPAAAVDSPLPTSNSSTAVAPTPPKADPNADLAYRRPSHKTMFRNYIFDTVGPYAIMGAALNGGIDQVNDSPPEWRLGAAGYGRRVANNFGIAAVSTTTRYALAQALREDTLYYRCECTGLFPRLKHALISNFTARRGADGHRALSPSAFVAPYAGNMAAVYVWYPGRFNYKDGFRMGNYSLLEGTLGSIVREFFYRGPR